MKNTKQCITLIIALLTCPFCTFGQSGEWLPIGATWDYSYWSFGDNERVQLEVSKDTVLSGKNVKKISLQSVRYVEHNNNQILDTADFQGISHLYMYEEQNKVYAWLEDSFYLQMDFSLDVGDTLLYRNNLIQKVNDPKYSQLRLDSLSELVLHQDTLKIQYFSNITPEYHFTYPVCIEKVGWLGFFTTVSGLASVSGHLRCYQEAGGFSYKSPYFDGACDTVYPLGDKQILIEDDAIDIWPNPVTHQLNVKTTLKLNIQSLSVYDTNGKIVATNLGNGNRASMNIKGLPKGLYLLRLFLKDRSPITKKFLKN